MDGSPDAGVDGMSKTWTREHNAVIAEKCEGLEIARLKGEPGVLDCVGAWGPPPDYRDLESAIRAAEAWRKRREGRMWTHGVDRHGVEYAHLFEPAHGLSAYSATGLAALAWALWEAVR